jgi:L-fucose isomerase-like protein
MTLAEWKQRERTYKFQGDTSRSFLEGDQYRGGPSCCAGAFRCG